MKITLAMLSTCKKCKRFLKTLRIYWTSPIMLPVENKLGMKDSNIFHEIF